MEASLSEAPGSHTVITWEAPYTLGQPRTLHSRVLVDGLWMPTREPLPGQLNARGEGLIGYYRTETGEHYWMTNLTAGSVNTTGKPTALWRNGKVLTISDLLGPNVDAQQVGTLWDINDHGLIAANSPTHGPALLVPVELVELSPRLVDEDGNEIANSHIPKHIPTRNPMVEIQPHINRIAHRELQIRLPESLAGRTIRWSMEPLFIPANSYGPAHTPVFRGSWTHAADAAHRNRFSASQDHDACGFELLSQETGRTTIAENGYTAVRINLPGIGFNQARISIQIEGLMTSPKPIIDFEVPAVVVIDPGHGGQPAESEPGGSSWNNATSYGVDPPLSTDPQQPGETWEQYCARVGKTLEKSLTLLWGLELRTRLAAAIESSEHNNYRIVMTRSTDENPTITARAAFARDNGADIFISIHFNGHTTNTAIHGPKTWIETVAAGNVNHRGDLALAQRIQSALNDSVPNAQQPGQPGYRGIKEGTVSGVNRDDRLGNQAGRPPHSRACLVEVDWITNQLVEIELISGPNAAANRTAVIEALSAAIVEDIEYQE